MIDRHVLDDIPAYVLEALNPEDHRKVEDHLSRCGTCRQEMLSYSILVQTFPEISPQHIPPVGLRASIMQKASHSHQKQSSSFKERIVRWLQPIASPVWGGVSLLLIVMLGVSNLLLFQQTKQMVQQQTEFKLVQMTGEISAANASGVIVISGDGNFGTLIVDGLPILDSAKQYQLWLIKDGKRTSGGVFTVLDNSYGVLVVNSPQSLSVYNAFGVTIEPAGGSPAPTGTKVLGGNI
jgi:anti-sigma-K factor RskA